MGARVILGALFIGSFIMSYKLNWKYFLNIGGTLSGATLKRLRAAVHD